MTMLPVTPFLHHLFDATIALQAGFRFFRSYRRTGNVYSRMMLVPLVVFFFKTRVSGEIAQLKKNLFGLAFLFGGVGGIGTTMSDLALPFLVAAYVVEFLGFLFLTILFMIDRTADTADADENADGRVAA